MKSITLITLLWLICGLTACQTGPSHIPPLYQIPGAAIGTAIENTGYKSRRNKVKASLAAHLDLVLTEADKGVDESFNMSCQVANLAPQKCKDLARQISQDAHIYRMGSFDERLEKLTIAFMVYGN